MQSRYIFARPGTWQDNRAAGARHRDERWRVVQNGVTSDSAAEFAKVTVPNMSNLIDNIVEVKEGWAGGHFGRIKYFRIYERIAEMAVGGGK